MKKPTIKAEGVKMSKQESGGAVEPKPKALPKARYIRRTVEDVVEEWQGVGGWDDTTMLGLLAEFVDDIDTNTGPNGRSMADKLDDKFRELAEEETEAGNIEVAE